VHTSSLTVQVTKKHSCIILTDRSVTSTNAWFLFFLAYFAINLVLPSADNINNIHTSCKKNMDANDCSLFHIFCLLASPPSLLSCHAWTPACPLPLEGPPCLYFVKKASTNTWLYYFGTLITSVSNENTNWRKGSTHRHKLHDQLCHLLTSKTFQKFFYTLFRWWLAFILLTEDITALWTEIVKALLRLNLWSFSRWKQTLHRIWCFSDRASWIDYILTLILLTWRIRWAPNNARRWQMGFNSAFKGLITNLMHWLLFIYK